MLRADMLEVQTAPGQPNEYRYVNGRDEEVWDHRITSGSDESSSSSDSSSD